MRILSAFLLAAALSAPLASQANATEYLTGYVGWFDFIDEEEESAQFGIEYRMNPIEYGFRPMIGSNVTADGSIYAYGGFHWDVSLIDNEIYVSPNFAVGGYAQGEGKDLGHGLEFRSGIELAYQRPNTHRVGLALNHISNASIGDKNPGAEALLLTYSVPTGVILGR